MTPPAAHTPPEIELVLETLASTPTQIARIVRGHDDRQLLRQPAAGEWSARDIVAHLRACAAVWGRCIDRMITEDHPTIRHVSPRTWIRKTDYLDQGFRVSLREFSEARARLLDRVRLLDAAGWSRRATVTGTTSGRDATVLTYARRIADHEVHHLDQLRRTVAR
ncbi:MAG: DinB family protein [Gemmatimonadaceae bacterium]|nr:DinB family protein [Gemmatimonadaceae bacterium]